MSYNIYSLIESFDYEAVNKLIDVNRYDPTIEDIKCVLKNRFKAQQSNFKLFKLIFDFIPVTIDFQFILENLVIEVLVLCSTRQLCIEDIGVDKIISPLPEIKSEGDNR